MVLNHGRIVASVNLLLLLVFVGRRELEEEGGREEGGKEEGGGDRVGGGGEGNGKNGGSMGLTSSCVVYTANS